MNSGSPALRKRRSYAASSSMGAIEAPGPDDVVRCSPDQRSGCAPPLAAYGEHRLEVVLGEDLEGDHRVGALDPVESGEPLGDHIREAVVLGNANDRHEIPLAGNRVGLGHAVDVGELAAEAGESLP